MKNLPIIYNRSTLNFIGVVLQKILMGFFIGFTITFLVGTIFQLPPTYNILILFALGVLLSSWQIYKLCQEWFWKFSLDDDRISMQDFSGNLATINKNEIQKVEWQNSRAIISDQSKTIAFDIRTFPGNQLVQLFYLLPRWVPRNALTSEKRQLLDEEENWLSQFSAPSSNPNGSTDFKKLLKDRDNIMIIAVQGLMTIACLIWLIAGEEKIYPILVFFSLFCQFWL